MSATRGRRLVWVSALAQPVILLLSLVSTAPSATAQDDDRFLRGTGLQLMCENNLDAVVMAYGYGVMGTISAMQVAEPTGALARLYCFPESISDQQVIDVICNHSEQHPESRQNSAASEIMLAFHDAWRCHNSLD